MSDSTNTILQRAYELIENDELEQAQALLAPLLETDEENPSLWWVYSHALRDQSIGQLALDRVLELDPSYPGAKELKDDVLEIQARDADLIALDADESVSAQDAAGSAIDDWDDLQPSNLDSDKSSNGRLGAVLLAIILFVVAAGIALVAAGVVDISEILETILPTPEAEVVVVAAPTAGPTALASDSSESTPEISPEAPSLPSESTPENSPEAPSLPSEEATEVSPAEPTEAATAAQETEVATQATTAATAATAATTQETTVAAEVSPTLDESPNTMSAFVGAVADSISDFELDQSASAMRSTSLGQTIVIQVCAVPGIEFNARLSLVINAMVDLADMIPADTEAVAAGLLNCDDDSARLRIIGVSVEAIQQYLDEAIDSKEFQRAWQPLS